MYCIYGQMAFALLHTSMCQRTCPGFYFCKGICSQRKKELSNSGSQFVARGPKVSCGTIFSGSQAKAIPTCVFNEPVLKKYHF